MTESSERRPENDESPSAATPRPSTNGSSTETVDQLAATVNPNLDAALSYVRRGFSVFPLRPHSKKPLRRWEEFQRRRATEAEVRAWWTENPTAGIAIVTGAVSGVVVIDCDPRNGGSNEETERDCPSG